MTNAIIEKAKERFAHTHESLAREFGAIRAGRANASLLDRITVEYYGAPTPLNQLASITVPEARVLLISPFDKGSIADIERAINESDLGINPANDGSVIRLVIPALTEETRKELAKEVKKVGENAKIAIRNIRRDAMDEAKKQEKEKEISDTKTDINAQITLIDRDREKINSKTSEYTTLTTNLQNASDAANTKNAYKNVITTFLSEIMYVIPKEVVLTSIENPSARKIVINAQSEKYEQLAYFKALLKSKGVLTPSSVVSSEATKEGNIVKIVIEGELP